MHSFVNRRNYQTRLTNAIVYESIIKTTSSLTKNNTKGKFNDNETVIKLEGNFNKARRMGY